MPPSNEASSSLASLLLQKCASTTTLRRARQLHALLLTTLPASLHTPFLSNNVLSMYARCGSLTESRLMFDRMPQRNIFSFNALIAAYSRSTHDATKVFKLLRQLEIQGLRKIGSTFTSLLQASSLLEDSTLGSTLHAQVIKFGFLGDTLIETALLAMYSNGGDLKSAKMVFSSIIEKDDVAWNSIIFGYIKNDQVVGGLRLYVSMMRSGIVPTHFTYSKVLNACSKKKDLAFGKVVHAQLTISGSPTDLPLHNSLLDMYCSSGEVYTGLEVFKRIERPDLVSYNSMIAGYSENGLGDEAMEMFIQLHKIPFVKPDEYTFVAIVSATGEFLASDYGKPLHAQVIKLGHEKSVYIASTLTSMYFNNHEIDSAQKVFSLISTKDAVLWTEMITGHCKMADGESAIKFFHGMLREGQKVDSFSLSIALSACADLVTSRQGEVLHCQAVKTGYDFEISVSGSLIDMYAKNGDLKAAESVISQIESPDLKCWNALLGGCGHYGNAEKAVKIFEEILDNNLSPDQVTFISLLAACSHCGLVQKGEYFWKYMVENGLKPGPKHYSCMVSLLSRAGLLEEAEEMIFASPFSEDYFHLWRTLLSSCITNKNFEIGIRAAEQVLNIDEDDSATLILLSNLYAATGKWDSVTKMRRKIRELMLDKDPGLSWIEVLNDVHVFSSGDLSHPKIDELQTVLYGILQGKLTVRETDEFHFRMTQFSP